MAHVLVRNPRDQALIRTLEAAGHAVTIASDDRQLGEQIPAADALYINPPARADRDLLARASRLRVLAVGGAGYDHVDVEYARDRGITIIDARGIGAASVAEYVLGVFVALSRQLITADRLLRASGFDRRWSIEAHQMAGKTMGIVGFGSIGQAVAARAQAFEMQVLTLPHSRPVDHPAVNQASSLAQLFSCSDYISVNVPLTPDTRGMIGDAVLAHVKPGSYLVNTSRGGVVDERALISALRSGRLRGAGIDVYASEPQAPSGELLQLDSVIATPHYAGITCEAIESMAIAVGERIARSLDSPAAAPGAPHRSPAAKGRDRVRER